MEVTTLANKLVRKASTGKAEGVKSVPTPDQENEVVLLPTQPISSLHTSMHPRMNLLE